MTEKQKKAFLKAEGFRFDPLWHLWIDPVNGYGRSMDQSVRIASRRKRQREARALRKRGYRWSAGAPGIEAAGWSLHRSEEEQLKHALDFWTGKVPLDQIMTRQEALQTLEAQP